MQETYQYRHKAWHCVLYISYHASLPSVLLYFVQEIAQTVEQHLSQTCGDTEHRLLAAREVPFILWEIIVVLMLDPVPDTQPNALYLSIIALVSLFAW